MGTTYLHAVASLDGYIARENDDVGPLHDWFFNGDHPIVADDHADAHGGAPFRVSAASAEYVRGMWERHLEAAVAQAKQAAGERAVMVHGGSAAQALLRAGLVDEIVIHLVPLLLGQGRRLFGDSTAETHQLQLVSSRDGEGALHLRYRVVTN